VIKKAAFGAGCFWHVQKEFDKLKEVTKTITGFMGGKTKNPSYEMVCAGGTGHAETIYIEYDEKKINYDELLKTFWKMHNPTELNRQGFDIGSQYRSVIFYYDENQKKKAIKSKEEEQKKHKNKIATIIEPAGEFYKAEEYHQKYYKKHGGACGL